MDTPIFTIILLTCALADTYVHTFTGQTESLTGIYSLDLASEYHEYVLFGSIGSSFAALKLSNTSQVQWCYKFSGNGSDTATAAIVSGTDSFVIVGRTNSFASTWVQTAMILKVYFSGTLAWGVSIGDGTYRSYFYDIKQTSDGGFIAVGDIYSSIQIEHPDH